MPHSSDPSVLILFGKKKYENICNSLCGISMSDVILSAYHGGLGDHLQFSTLPEEFYKQQGRKTYIWDKSPFRNPDVYDFVWGTNPYVLGRKEGLWNAGDIPEIVFENICGTNISNWEKLHGLEPKNRLPKIYYTPNKLGGYSDVFLVDMTSISTKYDTSLLKDILEKIQFKYSTKNFLSVTFKKKFTEIEWGLFEDVIEIDNIFHYYDIMNSVNGFIGMHSGASCMSSSVQEHNKDLKSICIVSKDGYEYHKNKGIFIFDNIEYMEYN